MIYKVSSEAEKCYEEFWVFNHKKVFFGYNRLEPFFLPPTDGTQYPPMSFYGYWFLFFLGLAGTHSEK